VVTEEVEIESYDQESKPKPINNVMHTHSRTVKSIMKPIDSNDPHLMLEQLKTENAALRAQNSEMRNELHKIESKYSRIAQLLDQVPLKLQPQNIIAEEQPQNLIDSVDSQATFVDENEIANKNIFSNGIMQILNGKKNKENEKPSEIKQIKPNSSMQENEITKLKAQIEKQKKIIRNDKEFIRNILKNLKQVADDSEGQSKLATCRSFFQ